MTKVQEFIERVATHWDTIPIRVQQDGKWQSLFLCEIKDPNKVIDWLIGSLENLKRVEKK